MENKLYIDCPKFTGRNVPITEIAKAIGKDVGYAMKLDKSSEYNYYCPDKKVWEETGYFRDKEVS